MISTKNREPQRRLLTLGLLSFLALLVVSVFWPGTSGSFLHDDKMNLSPLGAMGGITNLETLRHFVFSGVSSSLGRPVALLSFAWDGQNWPTDPRAFLISNILIHAVNALLLFAVVFKLCGMLRRSPVEARWIAFIAALLWAVHPIQIATVLYVVQRMTELATLFSLLAVWCYLHGRSRLNQSAGPAYWWMTGGLILFGGLAVLSKENAVLLPMLLLVLEFTLLTRTPRPDHWRHWAALFLWLPSLMIVSLLLFKGWNHLDYYAMRDFTMFERLLTQARVMMDYLIYMLLPLELPAVYKDGLIISRGLFAPISTLFSIVAIVVMLLAALFFRRQQPVFSFAVLWFFAAHLLESTVINLEIYYLHRNYLPMVGIAIAVAYYFVIWVAHDKIKRLLLALPIVIFMAVTAYYSSIWGDPFKVSEVWAEQQPDSSRAQLNYAGNLFSVGRPEKAVAFLDDLIERQPDFLGAKAIRLVFNCSLNRVTQQQFVDLVNVANTLKYDNGIGPAMHRLFDFMKEGRCEQIKSKGAVLLLDALIENPLMQQRKDAVSLFYNLKGSIYFHDNDLQAMDSFVKAYELWPTFDNAFRLANLYGSLGAENEARLYAAMAKQIDNKRNFLVPSRAKEVDALLDKYFKKKPLYPVVAP